MLRSFIILAFLIFSPHAGLYAEKILCISDYQGGGKSETLERLLETIFTNEEPIDIIIVAGDYIVADDLLTTIWVKLLGRPNARYPEILFARGNHDDAAAMVLDFSYPMPPSNARTNSIRLPDKKLGQVAAYQRDGLLFIVTDPFLSFKRKGYTKRQLDRLELLLSSSKYTHAFVVGHMPAFPKFRHIGKSLDHFTYARDRLVGILARHDAHFIHGHDHYANMLRIKASLHIGCGMINGAYGSAVVIDTLNRGVSVRYYEVEVKATQERTQLAYHYPHKENSEGFGLQGRWSSDRPYQPYHLWGSNRIPPSRPHYIEMGLMESNLEYFLDWINYFL